MHRDRRRRELDEVASRRDSATPFDNLYTLSRARTDRILEARTDTGPPPSLRAVILITSGLVLGLVIVQRTDTPATDYAMVALVGVLVSAQLFLS